MKLRDMISSMKNFISMFMILALVITTSFVPSMSHAMPHDGAKAVQVIKTEGAKGHDCHGHGEAKVDSQKTAQNDKESSKCCDKGMCKCVGGTCHNGLSKVFGSGSDSLLVSSSSKSVFGSTNESTDSAFLEGLKRPPRA